MVRVINILIVCSVLTACNTSPNMAPVQDRSRPIAKGFTHHVVSKGETLFAIAWRYGLNYKTLASYNGIVAPYTIYPGQKLRLDPPGGSASGSATATVHAAKPAAVARTSSVSRSVVAASPPVSVAAPTVSRSKTPTPAVTPKKTASAATTATSWQWPLRGKIISTYAASQGLSKGIDIAGRLGESVLAAGPGTVVYSGSGLRGYGNLLIIKHNEVFLSAYAHNSKLMVGEGEFVKAGQKIAEVGSSGTDKVMLHFEIRQDGQPVDPMRYLPK